MSIVALHARNEIVRDVTPESLARLAQWVAEIASPEELAWEGDKFKHLRDWMKTHRAAKELRIQAVRIECIALRKVGMAGISHKLRSTWERKAADWFASLSDERFRAILDDSANTTSPASVMNHYSGEERKVTDWISDRRAHVEDEAGNERTFYDLGIAHAVSEVLADVVKDGEPFDVASAASVLYDRLNEESAYHDEQIPVELAGEPLREVIRRALRAPGPADRVAVGDLTLTVPQFVTYQAAGGDCWQRVPWGSAVLWQLKKMVELRREQAASAERAAERMEALYTSLHAAQAFTDSKQVADLIGYSSVERAA